MSSEMYGSFCFQWAKNEVQFNTYRESLVLIKLIACHRFVNKTSSKLKFTLNCSTEKPLEIVKPHETSYAFLDNIQYILYI